MNIIINDPHLIFSLHHCAAQGKGAIEKFKNVWLSKDGYAYGLDGSMITSIKHNLDLEIDVPIPYDYAKQLSKLKTPLKMYAKDGDIIIKSEIDVKVWVIQKAVLTKFEFFDVNLINSKLKTPTGKIMVNPYLIEKARKAANVGKISRIEIDITAPGDPLVISNGEYKTIIMPCL